MKLIQPQPLTHAFPLALVVSHFNTEITEGLLTGALQRLQEHAFSEASITVVYVPGAVEIGLAAQRLAQTAQYQAIICLGAVIRGQTDHYDYVCQQVSHSCQQLALAYHMPIIFGVLTTRNRRQAWARARPNRHNKGREAVDAAIEMVSVLHQINHFT